MAKSGAKKRKDASANPIEMLKQDHRKVKDLFAEYESAGENATRKKQGIAEKVFTELEVHSSLEEEIFYPAVRDNGDEEGARLVAEATEEHRLVKILIDELRGLDADDEQFEAKFKVLSENVEHHADEEEREMFPVAREALGERIDRIGQEMHQRKQELVRERAA
jgi:hemerythrin-like domain-containing protein